MMQKRSQQRGMALLEVGVAMVVLSVSFLAVGLTLASAARNQRSGQAMVRAAALANDMAEQMRANRAAVEGVAPNRGFVLSNTYAALTQLNALAVPTCGGQYDRPPSTSVTTPACTNAKGFADYAVAVWLTQVQTTLPGGAGAIVDTGGNHRRIAVAWVDPVTDKSNGAAAPLTDQACNNVSVLAVAANSGVRCLVMDFQL